MLNLLLSWLSFGMLKELDWCQSAIPEYVSFEKRRVCYIWEVSVCDSEAILVVASQEWHSDMKDDEQTFISHRLPYLWYFLFFQRLWLLIAKFTSVNLLLVNYVVLYRYNRLSSVQLFDFRHDLDLIWKVFDLLLLFLLLVIWALVTNLIFTICSFISIFSFVWLYDVRDLIGTRNGLAKLVQYFHCSFVICWQRVSSFDLA